MRPSSKASKAISSCAHHNINNDCDIYIYIRIFLPQTRYFQARIRLNEHENYDGYRKSVICGVVVLRHPS